MDKESSRGIECVTRPKTKQSQSYLFGSPEPALASAKAAAGKSTLGRALQCDGSCVPPPFYRHLLITKLLHIHTHTHIYAFIYPPPPIPRLRRFEPPAWQAGLWPAPGNGCRSGWLLAGAGLLPLLQSRVVYGVLCGFCCWGVFPVLTLYSPRSIVWGFFFSPHLPHVMLYFSSIPCLPVLSTPLSYMYVVYGQVDG